jgi:uncharacterized repeat protein (TIGR01451 family)
MKWYVAAGLLLLAALFLESSLLAYATYVLLGVLVVSRLLAWTWLDNITVTRQCAETVVEVGAKVVVTLTVRNTGSVPVPWVLVEDMLPQGALAQRRLGVKGKRLKIALIRAGHEATLRYTLVCRQRGYYQVGPVILESGDVFGLHRRFAVKTTPHFLLVCPRMVPLEGYELVSRRPIGEVVLTHRLFEDPTRIAGVRAYEAGDPLNRIHWRATARTGQLQSKTYEATTLTGATILLDFHENSYPAGREPYRSELAVTAAASLASGVFEMGQQVGLATNARDGADRIRREGWLVPKLQVGNEGAMTRQAARRTGAMDDKSERLEPVVVETRRGAEHLQRLRETLARVELTDGITFAGLVIEMAGRLPRDATLVALLGEVSVETAAALGTLRRAGFALTAVLICMDEPTLEKAHGRLLGEGVRDVRHLAREEALPTLCQQQVMGRGQFETAPLAAPAADEGGPDWNRQTPYEMDSPEE